MSVVNCHWPCHPPQSVLCLLIALSGVCQIQGRHADSRADVDADADRHYSAFGQMVSHSSSEYSRCCVYSRSFCPSQNIMYRTSAYRTERASDNREYWFLAGSALVTESEVWHRTSAPLGLGNIHGGRDNEQTNPQNPTLDIVVVNLTSPKSFPRALHLCPSREGTVRFI